MQLSGAYLFVTMLVNLSYTIVTCSCKKKGPVPKKAVRKRIPSHNSDILSKDSALSG
jgi:hypothetical protein